VSNGVDPGRDKGRYDLPHTAGQTAGQATALAGRAELGPTHLITDPVSATSSDGGSEVPNTTWLADARDDTKYGGKAVSLSLLMRNSFLVPAAFCIPTNAVADLQANRSEIGFFLSGLHASRLAVRSSAIAEDGRHASYAGVFHSKLHVEPTLDQLLLAIGEVAESQNSVEAAAYRDALKLPRRTGIAVIVQEMLDTSRFGVLFTRNPVTGQREYIVEAYRGTPGDTTATQCPTLYSFDSRGSATPANDRVQRAYPHDDTPDEQIMEVVRIGQACEDLFGYPLDVEWAVFGERVWILQCREITAIDLRP